MLLIKRLKDAFLVTTLNYDIFSEMSELETLHDRGSRELANFIIDLEDEECPKFQLHLADAVFA